MNTEKSTTEILGSAGRGQPVVLAVVDRLKKGLPPRTSEFARQANYDPHLKSGETPDNVARMALGHMLGINEADAIHTEYTDPGPQAQQQETAGSTSTAAPTAIGDSHAQPIQTPPQQQSG